MINNILSGLYNQNNLLNTTVNVPEQVNSVQNELINSLLNLKEGMIFEAVVKNVNNNQILLSMADGQAVSARLESSDAFNVGDNVSFQVKSNENGQISIKSVPKSDYNNPAFLKALDAANMEATPKNLEMVKSMMEESLPINKQSLQNMHKLILNNPNADIKSLAQMVKYNIPVTDNNVTQFQNYRNYENQILKDINNLTQSLPELLGSDDADTVALNDMLLKMAFEGEGAVGGKETLEGQIPEGDKLAGAEIAKAGNAGMELEGIKQQIKEMSLPELKELIKNKDYQKLLSNALEKQWTLKPEEIATEKKLDSFYNRLNEHLDQLINNIENMGKKGEQISQTVNMAKGNLEFMNQINQLYTYVQIPLQLSNQKAHSDLYVFTNKKNLKEKEGDLTALLHLEMEKLGHVDVFLKLRDNNLETKFTLEDEKTIDLFANNIEKLNKRLNDKGYNCKIEFDTSAKDVNFVDDFLASGKSAGVPMQRYSFDVRM